MGEKYQISYPKSLHWMESNKAEHMHEIPCTVSREAHGKVHWMEAQMALTSWPVTLVTLICQHLQAQPKAAALNQ